MASVVAAAAVVVDCHDSVIEPASTAEKIGGDMKPNSKTNCGMTLFEVLIVIAVVLVLAALLLPALMPRPHAHYPRTHCANDLKQVGLAFQIGRASWRERA